MIVDEDNALGTDIPSLRYLQPIRTFAASGAFHREQPILGVRRRSGAVLEGFRLRRVILYLVTPIRTPLSASELRSCWYRPCMRL